ncbi:MAG TPA: DUF4159 domain-containing protein [Bryobacteraceae bacterium]|nr:DUF4159 domain-containing protein [Bryobacteraceae bacterium]
MRLRYGIVAAMAVLSAALFSFQAGFREFQTLEDNPSVVPPDANEKTEFAFARLMYPSGRWGWGRRGSWPTDYPKADRQFVQGVRRLTRIHTRSTEQVVDLDSDEIFNWPWIYAVEVGHWNLDDAKVKKLREYLLRGGFLMCDDFHGTYEWDVFMAGMSRVFPDRPVVEIDNADAIFHVLYDLDERFQVPGIQYWYSRRTFEKDGVEARWRGIYDDKGRVMVAICFNQDLGDAWEWADSPRYPEKYASLAYRLGINYIIYAMTH